MLWLDSGKKSENSDEYIPRSMNACEVAERAFAERRETGASVVVAVVVVEDEDAHAFGCGALIADEGDGVVAVGDGAAAAAYVVEDAARGVACVVGVGAIDAVHESCDEESVLAAGVVGYTDATATVAGVVVAAVFELVVVVFVVAVAGFVAGEKKYVGLWSLE